MVGQNVMDGNYLIVMCTLHEEGNMIKSHTLIDRSATSYAFVDKDYARCHHPPLYLLKSPGNLTVID
jgi:hypothetical protein